MKNISNILDATDPDLRKLKANGGKMIHYHGWADTALTPLMSVDYYESVLNFMGENETMEFYKLYMIPGTFHCGGGVGCFDRNNDVTNVIFPALVNWVENGIAPTFLIGTRPSDSCTRPMCPYPQVAVYDGDGDICDASNFYCD